MDTKEQRGGGTLYLQYSINRRSVGGGGGIATQGRVPIVLQYSLHCLHSGGEKPEELGMLHPPPSLRRYSHLYVVHICRMYLKAGDKLLGV